MPLITKEAIEGKKVNIKEFYNLPEKVIHCTKCTVSNQRPRITFDKNNVCSACNFAEKKHKFTVKYLWQWQKPSYRAVGQVCGR